MYRSIVLVRTAAMSGMVLAALLSPPGASQNANSVDFDPGAAETHFKEGLGTNFVKPLREYPQAADGARGFGAGSPFPYMHRLAMDEIPKPFTSKVELYSFMTYCQFDAIVLAVHTDSTPVLNGDKTLIYTVSHFSVLDTIKSDVAFIRGQTLTAYRLGGEVDEGGEKLAITTPDWSAFVPQKTYLLNLTRDKNASVQQYALPENLTIAVKDGKVLLVPGRFAWRTGWDAFPSGTAYARIKSTFARAVKLQYDCGRM